MADFEAQMRALGEKYEKRGQAIFNDTVVEMYKSFVEGSPLTGSEGQPVDTHELRDSNVIIPQGIWRSIIGNVLFWSPWVNAGKTPGNKTRTRARRNRRTGRRRGGRKKKYFTKRSSVGGFHFLEKTVMGYNKIVEAVVARHTRAG